jgi:hypothetical protein
MSNNIIMSTTTIKESTKKVVLSTESLGDNVVAIQVANMPTTLEDVKNYIELSAIKKIKDTTGKVVETKGGKMLPCGDTEVSFSTNIEGVDIVVSGRLAVWLEKSSVAAVEEAIAEKIKKAELARKAELAKQAVNPVKPIVGTAFNTPTPTPVHTTKVLPASMLGTLNGTAIKILIDDGYVFTA